MIKKGSQNHRDIIIPLILLERPM